MRTAVAARTLAGVGANDHAADGSIDSFPNPHPGRDYEIRFEAQEFTSLCPMTGQPDFGAITLTYTPAERCIELRSFKFYLQSFRQRGIFYEGAVNAILDDVVAAVAPRRAVVCGEFHARGGIRARVTASHPQG